ncbi:YopX family protein [Levilactobacillus brevis]|uniref:YopX family protein n=1 Tax=Levilactobacillus brevis TaxID=1580 RepID=UPI000BE99B51|nr:YopX family protein [Levilactobacillus brevis]MCZ2120146.1 YopX family protein [Levilactobacillus brevis]MCZ2125634.1 YopX family protein [Levilactobacillus brevis]MCZ2209954.1 YopX family protein [Levilactobacillus brevis]MCZ2325426.1 YopX family protein [Levilactobacillus brevis]
MIPKFRVWDETQHKMLQVDCIEFIDGKAYWVEASPADGNVQGGNDGPVGDNSQLKLEQYTGLKDANGKEIYEGDVVHGYDQEPDRDDGYIGSSVIEVVNFKWGSFWLGDFKNQIKVYTPPIIEVIGNVHMNPELLEAQHDTRTD